MFEPFVSNVVSRLDRAARRVGPGAVLPGLAAAALLFAPLALEAQDDDLAPGAGTLSVSARGGLGIPVDASSFDGFTRTGGSFGADLSLLLSRSLAITASGDVQLLEDDTDRAGVRWADMRLVHVTGGPEFHFTSPETRWTGTLFVGAGITKIDQSGTLDDGTSAPASLENTGLTFRAATKLGYRAAEGVTLFLEPGVYLATLDRASTSELAAVSGAIGAFDTGWTIPLQAGVRFDLR